MAYINIENYDIIEVYRYPSYVNDIIAEYDEIWHNKPIGDRNIKRLYEQAIKIVNEQLNKNVDDNKVAILLKHKTTGREIIVGNKDNTYKIGLSVFCEFPSNIIKL
jgi:hypothetical protein